MLVAFLHMTESVTLQVEIINAEAYAYDGECIAKAEEMRKPGLIDIQPKQVCMAIT